MRNTDNPYIQTRNAPNVLHIASLLYMHTLKKRTTFAQVPSNVSLNPYRNPHPYIVCIQKPYRLNYGFGICWTLRTQELLMFDCCFVFELYRCNSLSRKVTSRSSKLSQISENAAKSMSSCPIDIASNRYNKYFLADLADSYILHNNTSINNSTHFLESTSLTVILFLDLNWSASQT